MNTQASINTLNAGLCPASAGESHTFGSGRWMATGERHPGGHDFTSTPVQNVKVINAWRPVGYMLFNDHIATAEAAADQRDQHAQDADVTDLVLDIRYNGGGYLDIASELAYMIAARHDRGPAPSSSSTFNDKHPTTDPGDRRAARRRRSVHTTTQGFSVAAGPGAADAESVARLRAHRPGTCSASESIINGLRGVGVQVIQIGSTTCGKPYGFYPADNCGTTYFSIQFQGVNAKDFGDYTDGFSPSNPCRHGRCAAAGLLGRR